MEGVRTTIKNKKFIVVAAVLLVAVVSVILFLLLGRGKDELAATTIRIISWEGTVSLTDDGEARSLAQNMQLRSGNQLATDAASSVDLNLDDTKAAGLDENSLASFIKENKQIKINLESGGVYFYTTEKLASDESFDIQTGTMIVGIRGTSGYVGVDAKTGEATLALTSGEVEVTGINPQTGGERKTTVRAGQTVHVYLHDDKTGEDSVTFDLQNMTGWEDIPKLLAKRLLKNPKVLARAIGESGLPEETYRTAAEDLEQEDSENTQETSEATGTGETEKRETSVADNGSDTDMDSAPAPGRPDGGRHAGTDGSRNRSGDSIGTPNPSGGGSNGDGGDSQKTSKKTDSTRTDSKKKNSDDSSSAGGSTKKGTTGSGAGSGADNGSGDNGSTGNGIDNGSGSPGNSDSGGSGAGSGTDSSGSPGGNASGESGNTGSESTENGNTESESTENGNTESESTENGNTESESTENGNTESESTENETPDTYWVRMDVNEGGTLTVNQPRAAAGTKVSFQIQPAVGYELVAVSVTDAKNQVIDIAEDDTFLMPECDVTISVSFRAEVYGVTLEPNGGMIGDGNVDSYTYGEGVILPLDVTLLGYQFVGWYTDNEFTGSPIREIARTETGDKWFYASWQAEVYSVTLETNGGTIIGDIPDSYAYGEGVVLPQSVVKTGYNFSGWYMEEECSGSMILQIGTESVGDRTYYAKWTPRSYTVTYETNGGSIKDDAIKEYTCGVGGILPREVVKDGYNFDGWYDNNELTGLSIRKIPLTETGDKTYYAKWTAGTYMYHLMPNGGTVEGGSQRYYTYGAGAVLPTADEVTREGYRFVGWYASNDYLGEPITEINKEQYGVLSFFAKWEEMTYKISYSYIVYNSDGSTTTKESPDDFLYSAVTSSKAGEEIRFQRKGSDMLFLQKAVRAGDGKEPVQIETKNGISSFVMPADDVEVMIICGVGGTYGSAMQNWQITEYLKTKQCVFVFDNSITENLEVPEGKYLVVSGTMVIWPDVTVTVNGTLCVSDTGTIKNYGNIICGDTGGFVCNGTLIEDSEVYKINLNTRNNQPISSGKTVYCRIGETVKLPNATPDRGYTFSGWEDAEGKAVTEITASDTGETTVYAVYTPITYTVKLELNDGTLEDGADVTSYTHGSSGVAVELPDGTKIQREGYTFAGWYTNSSFTGNKVEKIYKTEIGNKTYYAKWEQIGS